MKRTWILMLATVMLLAVLVGCSNNNTTDPTKPSAPTEPTVTTPTTGEEPTAPTDPTTPTVPTTPDVTEPTEPSQPENPTEPTEPTKPTVPDNTQPPTNPEVPVDPDIVKPNISEKHDALWMVPLSLNDAYDAWQYITNYPAEYIGEQFYALGIYRIIDGKDYFYIAREDGDSILIEIELLENWHNLPENIEMQLRDNCFILLNGTFARKADGTVYVTHCDLYVNAHLS